MAMTATSAAVQDRRDIAAPPPSEIKQWTNSIGMTFIRIKSGEFMTRTPVTACSHGKANRAAALEDGHRQVRADAEQSVLAIQVERLQFFPHSG
jgi:hypothetical protein